MTGVQTCALPIAEHAHGIFHSNEGSVYSYTDWFYDGDTDAFSVI